MKKKDVKTWVAALRSGNYKQGKSRLHGQNCDGEVFCCLGVAVDVLIEGDWKKYDSNLDTYSFLWGIDKTSLALLSEDILKEIGLNEHVAMHLADMNDHGCGFDEIADWIEKNSANLDRIPYAHSMDES